MWQTLVGVFVGVSSLFGGLFATSAPASQPAAVAQAVMAPAASTTPPSLSGQAPSSSSGQATIVEQHITQPVIERTVERIVREPAQEPVTLPILALLFNQLDNKLTGKINNTTVSNNQGLAPVWQAVAQSQRIDQLTNTTISTPIIVNPTVNGGTLSGVTVSANSITTGTLSAATTTITGDLTVSGTVTGGTLSVSGLSSGGAVSAPYFTATSTTATSSFQALAAAGYATLATTTIAGPLTLSQTASALLSTDSLGQIVATTTLAASYLALPQGYTLVGGASGTAQATSSLYVANTGNVGIGTTSPWAKFSINNSTADTAGQPLFTIASSTASATTTAFIVTNNGNVGIGTTSPISKLAVTGRTSSIDNSTIWGGMFGGTGGAGTVVLGNYSNVGTIQGADDSNASHAVNLSINPLGGNVGIGTTGPAGKLQVYNGNILVSNTATNPASSGAVNGLSLGFDGNLEHGWIQAVRNNIGEIRDLEIQPLGGNIGIGTTTIGARLTIQGSGATSATKNLSLLNSAGTEMVTVLNNGNVGIGTTSPSRTVHVYGTSPYLQMQSSGTSGNGLVLNNQNGTSFFGLANAVENQAFGIGEAANATVLYGYTLQIGSGGAIRTTFTSAGNVGIGTTTPTTPLHVASTGTRQLTLENDLSNGTTGINFATPYYLPTNPGSISSSFYADGMVFTSPRDLSGWGFKFNSNSGNTKMFIDTTSGNVGIGTTSPVTLLDIYTTGQANGRISATTNQALWKAENSGGLSFFGTERSAAGSNLVGSLSYATLIGNSTATALQLGTNNNVRMTIDSTGNVGIGTTSPALKLQVNGNIGPNTDNTYTDGTATYRWSAVYAANGTIQTSDARLKSNVTDLNYGLADLMKLHPVSFTWTSNPEQGTKLGFIAQEVQPVMPEVVNTGDDANHTLGITYTEFIPTIVKAIQELNGKIGTLADTVAGFADHFVTKELSFDRAAGDTMTLKTLCLSDANGTSCYTRSQLDSFVQSQGAAQTAAAASTQGANATPATLTLNGNATSTIALGASYNDLGATFTHSGITETIYATSTVDTSVAGTTTLDYWATWYPDPAATTSAETLHTVREVVVTDPNAEQGNATNTTQTATSTGQ